MYKIGVNKYTDFKIPFSIIINKLCHVFLYILTVLFRWNNGRKDNNYIRKSIVLWVDDGAGKYTIVPKLSEKFNANPNFQILDYNNEETQEHRLLSKSPGMLEDLKPYLK